MRARIYKIKDFPVFLRKQILLPFTRHIVHSEFVSSNQKPVAAFVLSLLSGIFIIFGGSVWCLWLGTHWDMGWMDWMMHEWDEHMHAWNMGDIAYAMGIVGIVLGIMIIVAAVMLYMNPTQHVLWGTLIIVLSVISIVSCMGGLGAGLILGAIGGVLAILWKPEERKRMQRS